MEIRLDGKIHSSTGYRWSDGTPWDYDNMGFWLQTVTVLTIVPTIMDGDVIVVPQVDPTIFVKYRNL